jgi:hypothetical protein
MCNPQFQHLQYTLVKMYICLNCFHNCLTILTTYLKTSCTSEYQLKLEKCFKCFTLDMKIYVGMQWSIGIIVARRHELDTWHVTRMQTKNGMKPH